MAVIIIPIPTGFGRSCTISGSTFKLVQCEHCQFNYVYCMTRSGSGEFFESFLFDTGAGAQAEAKAQFELKLKLRRDCDAVPCPACGKFQKNMVEALRKELEQRERDTGPLWLSIAAVAGLIWGLCHWADHEIFSAVPPFAGLVTVAPLAGFVFGALVLLATIFILMKRYEFNNFDPNGTHLSERMSIAAKRAKSLDEFRAYLKAKGIEWAQPAISDSDSKPSSAASAPSAKNQHSEYGIVDKNRRTSRWNPRPCPKCNKLITDLLLDLVPDADISTPDFKALIDRKPGGAIACPYCDHPLEFSSKGAALVASSRKPVRYSRIKIEKRASVYGDTCFSKPNMTPAEWAANELNMPGAFEKYHFAEDS